MSKTEHMKTRKNKKDKQATKKTYSLKDYSSGDGFLTTVWGPMMWSYLHTMSFNYPVNPTDDDKKHYREFVINLQYVLPCKYCRMNLTNNFKKMPISACHMKNRDTFSRYIYNLHETVNKMLKKKSNLSYCEVRDRYENFRSRCTEESPKIFSFKRLKDNKTRKVTGKKEENNEKNTKEKGCTEPLYGKKSKCVIKIVPQEEKQATFQMDKKCIKSKDPDILKK
jgi:hypothetical protein